MINYFNNIDEIVDKFILYLHSDNLDRRVRDGIFSNSIIPKSPLFVAIDKGIIPLSAMFGSVPGHKKFCPYFYVTSDKG